MLTTTIETINLPARYKIMKDVCRDVWLVADTVTNQKIAISSAMISQSNIDILEIIERTFEDLMPSQILEMDTTDFYWHQKDRHLAYKTKGFDPKNVDIRVYSKATGRALVFHYGGEDFYRDCYVYKCTTSDPSVLIDRLLFYK